ncbi:Nucleolar GTP-binding protein 1 [Glugoides intestinalis]
MIQNFNHINPVPQCTELIDMALSKTNRKTPTVIHPGYQIQRIRTFYIRKVKHSAEEFNTKLNDIVIQFPILEDIHPFYSDLISVLYDRDHYKIALGQVNSTKSRIEKTMAEHSKLLKFGDSLYRCKQLKRAALGKMASVVKKLAEPLKFLEEVRQHLSRLPSIDTSTRTIVICGYPNVGKSSFINKVSRAHVDVQPYAFTTKSLYVGHFEYENLTWQILDTPGILDHPLDERNTIEMLTITALAHLKSAVLFFMDLSEECGYSITEQISLYNSLSPLLSSQILIVLSKCDILKVLDIQDGTIRQFLEGKKFVEVSSIQNLNIELARNTICDMLLSERVSEKQEKMTGFLHRLNTYVPHDINEKDIGEYLGQNQFQGLPENEAYYCDDKYDIIPEIYNGKNIADFLDKDIQQKLLEVMKNEPNYTLGEYDVLTPEQRRMYEDCNNARIHANMMGLFNKRAAIPLHRKNIPDTTKPVVVDHSSKQYRKSQTLVPRPSRNKKVAQDRTLKIYADSKPKHIFRPTKNKHS